MNVQASKRVVQARRTSDAAVAGGRAAPSTSYCFSASTMLRRPSDADTGAPRYADTPVEVVVHGLERGT